MKATVLVFSILFLSVSSWGKLLVPEGRGNTLEKLSLATAAQVQVGSESLKLSAVGAGLRAKKVVFVNVKVYVGQLFVSNSESFKRNDAEALGSLKDQKAVAIQLHFLRSVDSENVQKSFKEALAVNGIKEDPSIQQFLEAVVKGGEAKEGKVLTILGMRSADGSESVFYENTEDVVSEIKGSTGFVEKIFAIWLGKPADDGVAQLKRAILK